MESFYRVMLSPAYGQEDWDAQRVYDLLSDESRQWQRRDFDPGLPRLLARALSRTRLRFRERGSSDV